VTAAPRHFASGFVAPEVAVEFPGLRLDWGILAARPKPSPPALVAHLQRLAGRFRGSTVIAMRTKPIPHAYRAFFRQIGLDPDVDRIPSERVALERLLYGGFRSVDLINDACLVSLVETGVPVWALDAEAIDERGLGIRTITVADAWGSGGFARLVAAGAPSDQGSLVVTDGSVVHGLLFADPLFASAVRRGTERVALFAVAVDGVPAIHVEEALWLCSDLIRGSEIGGC